MYAKILIVFIVSLIVIATFRVSTLPEVSDSNDLKIFGQVSTQPYLKGESIKFNVSRYQVTSTYQNISYGDKVTIEGDKVGDQILAKKVEIKAKEGIELRLYQFRKKLEDKIKSHFPSPEAELLSGILLGTKSNLPREFKEDLISTGTLHVVVVSGFNIVLVGNFALLLASVIGRKKAVLLALVLISFYSFLVGLEAPTLRALIMGSIALIGTLLGRKSLAIYSLFVTALAMLILNPEFLYDISFQLSFMATTGVLFFSSYFQTKIKFLPKVFAESLATTLAAQILVQPLIFFYFGNVSLLSPLVNTIVLWTIPISTALGVIFLSVSFLLPFLAELVSYLLVLPLKFFTFIVEQFGKIDIFVITFERQNLLTTIGFYLLVLGFGLSTIRTVKNKKYEGK